MSNSNKRPSINVETTNSKRCARNSLTPLYGNPSLSKSFTKLRRKSDYLGQHGEALSTPINMNGLSISNIQTEGVSMTKQKKSHKNSESVSKKIQALASLDKEKDKNFLINILKKTSEDRTVDEITFLQEAFRDINVLAQADKELNERTFQKLLSKLKLETFKPGEQVFQYGENGTKFYIIIQGSVYILLKKRQIVGQSVNETLNLSNRNMSKKDLLLFSNRETSEEVKIKKLESCYQGFLPPKTLSTGESFGEIALQISGNRTRTATVLCKEETIFGVLSAEDYQESLGRVYEREYGKRLDLFKEMHLFKHWNQDQISQLLLQTEEVAYQRNQPVFKEGDLPDRMYFVMQGEIELWRRIELEDKSSPSVRISATTTPTNLSKARQVRKRKEMRLAKISVGQYFGASGILDNKMRDYSAISSSNEVRLISLTKEKFALFVKDPQTLEKLTSHIQQKEMWRESHANNYVNINSLYTSDYEGEKTIKDSKLVTVLPNRSSMQWKDIYSLPVSPSSKLTNKKLSQLLERTSSTKGRPTNHTSNKSHTIHKESSFSRKIASPSPPPGNQGNTLTLKRSESKDRERFQILSFEQKSPLKRKSELEATYSRFQKRLDRILTRQQSDLKQQEQLSQPENQEYSELNNQLQLEKLKKAVRDDDCLEDFSLNFTRNGLPIHSQASLHLPLLPMEYIEANDSLMVAGYGFKDSKETKEIESPGINEGLKVNVHDLLKYKLIKKLKIDRLYRDGRKTPENYLKIQLSMNNESIDYGRRMRSPALSTTIQRLNRSQMGQSATKFNKRDNETPESSLSYIIKNNKTLNSQYETSISPMINSPLKSKSSKMIYSKIQQVIDVHK